MKLLCHWREVLALKEALIKFQFLEGEQVLAITDHTTLTWSTTFQNVNRRLLTWGTVFAAYPKLRIIHHAGKVHSNVDPISQPQQWVPYQASLNIANITPIPSSSTKDPVQQTGPSFWGKVTLHSQPMHSGQGRGWEHCDCFSAIQHHSPLWTGSWGILQCTELYNLLVSMDPVTMEEWRVGYEKDAYFSIIIADLWAESRSNHPLHPKYHYVKIGMETTSCVCLPLSGLQ